MKIADHLVQAFMDEDCDKAILHREAFNVNLRLYKANASYRKVILEVIRYMDEHLHSSFEDYSDPRGVAAPNLGFPFRIIGYKKKVNENQFCMNPKITYYSNHTCITNTNDGSLRLKENISIERSNTIDFEYCDLEGSLIIRKAVTRSEGGFTIQNIIDQCNGITIVDRFEMEKEKKKV